MTSYARATSGLSDVQTLHLFHRLMREGRERGAFPPTQDQLADWRYVTRSALEGGSDSWIPAGQRERILQRMTLLPSDFVPDGPTFHAWQNIRNTANSSSLRLNRAYRALARRQYGDDEDEAIRRSTQVAEQAANYANSEEAARWIPPPGIMDRLRDEFGHLLDEMPQDKRTLYALSRLIEDYPRTAQPATPPEPAQTQTTPPAQVANAFIPRDEPEHLPAVSSQTANPYLPPTPSASTSQNRCPNCGQFVRVEEEHQCPAEEVLRFGRHRGQTMGDLLESDEGRSYLDWLSDSNIRGGSLDIIHNRGRPDAVNVSELARQLLAGRSALAAEQAAAAAPVSTPTPPQTAPAPGVIRRRWARVANEVRQNLTAEEQAQLRVAQEAQVLEAARPGQEAALAPKLSGAEGQATYDSWVAELKAARTAGSGPPYETERVLGDAATRFGVELEFKEANTDAVARKLYDLGLAGHPQMMPYHHACSQCEGKWKVERDGSVTEIRNGRSFGGEVVAPILQDTPEHWQQLKLVSDTIKELGGRCDQNTGQHVHISTASYDNQGSKYRNLALEVAAHEDLLYRMSAPDQEHHRGLLRTDQPEYHYAQPIAPRVQQFLSKPAPALSTVLRAMRVNEMAHDRVPWAHYMSLNMQHVNTEVAQKSRVEFRTFNGTIDPAQIQTNVRLAAGLVHAAGRSEGNPPEQRDLGWHQKSHSPEEDSQQIRGLIDRLQLSESGAKAVLDTFLRGRWQYQSRAALAQAS